MALQFTTWLDQIDDAATSSKGAEGNRLLSILSKATEFLLDDNKMINNLTDDEDSVFIAVGLERQPMLFHHPINFGGKLARPKHKIIALNGFDQNAKAFITDATSLCEAARFKSPLESILLGFNNTSEVKTFTFDQQGNGEMVKLTPAFLLHPYIKLVLMSFWKAGGSLEALDLIPLFARAAKDFDAAYEDDEGEGPEAAKNVGELLQFLWGMVNKKLNKISIVEASEDEEAKAQLLAMKARRILPPNDGGSEIPSTPNEKSAFKQITSTLSRVTEQLESTNKLTILQIKQREEREDKKKDKTLDLHPSTIHMLKNGRL
jgi:hypothetical protein